MPTCEKCGQDLPDYEFNAKLREILGPNLELYDFGTGVTAVPMHSEQGWLTTLVAYVIEQGPNYLYALGFTIESPASGLHKGSSQLWIEAEILRKLPEAKQRFLKEHIPVSKAGGTFPPPRF